MFRAVLSAAAFLLLFHPAPAAQTQAVLHIKVVLTDAQGNPAPVPRHELLISDNPATAAPRVIATKLDGTADVTLKPGNYTVESDHPVVFQGKTYGWSQVVDVVAGREAVLELTAANAEIQSPSSRAASGTPLEADPSFLVAQWQDSVVALWTPLTRASAFVVDSRGLVVTSQRAVGTSRSVEVQLAPATKVPGVVVAADRSRDVAVVRVDSRTMASIKPVPLGCGGAAPRAPTPRAGETVFTIAVPLREPRQVISGKIGRAEPGAVLADFALDADGAGGPVFASNGDLAGITSVIGDEDENRRGDVKIVPIAEACEVLAAAEEQISGAASPGAAALPMEPVRTFPESALRAIVRKRAGSLAPYTVSSSEFDLAFITPVQTYAVEFLAEQARDRDRDQRVRASSPQAPVSPLMDFGNWSRYAEDIPAVLFVRVTPRMSEGFWTRVGRGAARTQGMAIPPLKRFTYSFSRLQAFCGETEVLPIHPFKIEHRVSDALTVYEGLYVFDPASIGPRCGAVKLVMFSDRQPPKADTRVIDAGVIQQIWQDFEPYRRPAH